MISEDSIVNTRTSPDTLVDFEIAFFTVILTAVLAYPAKNAAYQVLKLFLIVFAVLTVVRRIAIMTDYSSSATRFMIGSKHFMIEVSILGIVHVIFVFSQRLGQLIEFVSPLWAFILGLFTLGFLSMGLLLKYASDDFYQYQAIVSSYQANTSPVKIWRDISRTQAINYARKIDRPDSELPSEIVALRKKEPRRLLPFPNETAQFVHGLLIRVSRRSFGILFGWAVFGNLGISVILYFALALVGGQVNLLFKRFGLESFHQRPGRRVRLAAQNIGVFFAHFIISPLF
ncbi:hypothetical protein [Haloprofundus marisrubri]|uniref:hypothetical protein n=1 Tax=Haloprofundus marisrubri TaxID=1514971 RepID=UPI0012BAC5BF|nr:hypothetical protein [Haloprofundus marisrubri]